VVVVEVLTPNPILINYKKKILGRWPNEIIGETRINHALHATHFGNVELVQ